jgi:rhodanese-related sulfurtransferase
MSLPAIDPCSAKRLIDQGAILVDIREPDEHARERIAGARNIAVSRLDPSALGAAKGDTVIFHCASGARTLANAPRLSAQLGGACDAYILEGGIGAWKQAGLPVAVDRTQPLELQRQVQLGAGSLALAGTLLGVFLSPWFLLVPGFVGAGLIVAGATGFCGMARLLMRAPWNRATYGSRVTSKAGA